MLFNLCLLRPEGVSTPLKYLCYLCTIVHAHVLLSWFRIKSDIFLFGHNLPIFTSPVNHTRTRMSFSKTEMHFDFLLLPSRKKSDAYWVSKVSYDLGSTYHTSYPSFLLVFTIHVPARETKLPVFLWCFCAFVKGTPPQLLLSSSHLWGLNQALYLGNLSHSRSSKVPFFSVYWPVCALGMHRLYCSCLSFSCAHPLAWCRVMVSKGRLWSQTVWIFSLFVLLTTHAILGKLYTFGLWLNVPHLYNKDTNGI